MGKGYKSESDYWVKNTDYLSLCFVWDWSCEIALTFSFISSSSSFLYFPLSVEGLFVLYIADSADILQTAKLLVLQGLCGAQGSYLSACSPTSLLQEPKFIAMQKVDTTRWMSLTTIFQL